MLMVMLSLVIKAVVQSVVMVDAGCSWLLITFQLRSAGWLVVLWFPSNRLCCWDCLRDDGGLYLMLRAS